MSIRTALSASLAFALATTLTTTACAPGTTQDGDPTPSGDATTITVVHDVRAATTLTVHLITPTGTRQRLGTVRPGEMGQFELGSGPVSGDYQLVAELADGRTFTSRPFILTGREGVEWSPADNIVTPVSGD